MEKIDKIFELLERKTITEAETKLLDELSESDDELKSFINVYRKLNTSLSASMHLHTDLLVSFILYEMGDEAGNKLIPLLKDKIKTHLNDCSVCRDEYKLLSDEYKVAHEFVDQSIVRAERKNAQQKRNVLPIQFFKSISFKYAFAAIVILLIGYSGLFIISSSITPDYKKEIFSDNNDDFYKTRGRTSDAFQHGLYAIENGDFESAVKYLSEDINKHPDDKSIFYSYYILGISYLRHAESEFLGLFKSFNKEDVKLAIENLNHSIEKNNSGDYESLKLDSYYYLGRAYLLVDNFDMAKTCLHIVVNGKGRYSKESSELIKQLEEN